MDHGLHRVDLSFDRREDCLCARRLISKTSVAVLSHQLSIASWTADHRMMMMRCRRRDGSSASRGRPGGLGAYSNRLRLASDTREA